MLFFGSVATRIIDLRTKSESESGSPKDNNVLVLPSHSDDKNSFNSEITSSQANDDQHSNTASSITSQPQRRSKKMFNYIKNMLPSSRRQSTLSENGMMARFEKEDLEKILKSMNEGYKEENLFKLTNSLESKENHNYLYIKNLFADFCFYDITDKQKSQREVSKRKGLKTKLQNSFLYSLFLGYVYTPIPFMKFSKQFVNTFTVGKLADLLKIAIISCLLNENFKNSFFFSKAFMVIYFFTLFGFKLSNIFGNALVGTIELVYKFVFRGLIPSIDTDNHNFNTEFRLATFITSSISFYHMFKSIKRFREDLVKLHKGEKKFSSLVLTYRNQDYKKVQEKRSEASRTIALDSLHFPGYIFRCLFIYLYYFLLFEFYLF